MNPRALMLGAMAAIGLVVIVIVGLVTRSAMSEDAAVPALVAKEQPKAEPPARLARVVLPARAKRGCLGARSSKLVQWRGPNAPRAADLPMTRVTPSPRGPLLAGMRRNRLTVLNPVTGQSDRVWPPPDEIVLPGTTVDMEWSPDGRRLAVTVNTPSENEEFSDSSTFLWSPADKARKQLPSGSDPRWSPSGRFLLMSTDGPDEIFSGDATRRIAVVRPVHPDEGGDQVVWLPNTDVAFVMKKDFSHPERGGTWLIWPSGKRQKVGPALRDEGPGSWKEVLRTSQNGKWAAGVTTDDQLLLISLAKGTAHAETHDLTELAGSPVIPSRFFTLVDPPEPVEPFFLVRGVTNEGNVALGATRLIDDSDYYVDALFWLDKTGSVISGAETKTLFDLTGDGAVPTVDIRESSGQERVAAVTPAFNPRIAIGSPAPPASWSIVARDFKTAIVDDQVRFAATRSPTGDVSVVALDGAEAARLIATRTRPWKRAPKTTDPELALRWAMDGTAVVITCGELHG